METILLLLVTRRLRWKSSSRKLHMHGARGYAGRQDNFKDIKACNVSKCHLVKERWGNLKHITNLEGNGFIEGGTTAHCLWGWSTRVESDPSPCGPSEIPSVNGPNSTPILRLLRQRKLDCGYVASISRWTPFRYKALQSYKTLPQAGSHYFVV